VLEDDRLADLLSETERLQTHDTLPRHLYFKELLRLQRELIKLMDWVVFKKLKLVVIFEGRDAAGKGGVIKRVTQRLNPRVCRTVALPAPTERERGQWYFQRYVQHLPTGGEIVLFDRSWYNRAGVDGQWYFQRYVQHLPTGGEIVLFDRSWYNRAGVELVMGFCTDEEYEEFFQSAPEFERLLVRSGIVLVKYWFSITDDEQNLRFLMRINDPLKQWKLSPMDLESRRRWELYTKAKETMLERTHIPEAPWWVVEADDKKRARLNCIAHLLTRIPYQEVPYEKPILPKRAHSPDYHRTPVPKEMHVPDHCANLTKVVSRPSAFPRRRRR
jgi:polyphosphate kinase 2 (PPK2 family)